LDDVYALTGRVRTFFRVVAFLSFAVTVFILAYWLVTVVTQGVGVIGSSLVDQEIPPPSLFPIYAKPVTLLYAASLTFMYTELEVIRERALRLANGTLQVFKLLAFFGAAIAFFELAYNFIFWGGELAAQAVLGHLSPDTIANPFPDLLHPINVVFATKIAAVALIAGVYSFYYISKIQDWKAKSVA
jgi:hypothetical protein